MRRPGHHPGCGLERSRHLAEESSTLPASGLIRVVCHADTAISWDSSGGGNNAGHDGGLNCTECHAMAQGFKP